MPTGFDHPETCAHVRLLGPCFKTGRMEPYGRQHLGRVVCRDRRNDRQQFERTGMPSATFDMPDRPTNRQPRTRRLSLREPRSPSSHANARLNNRSRRAVYLPRAFITRRQPTLTLTRQKCAARTRQTRTSRPCGSRARTSHVARTTESDRANC